MTQQYTRPPAAKGPEMGRVVTPVILENSDDVAHAAAGFIPADSIRRLEVAEALVDTGASTLCLPPSLIQALGLRLTGHRPIRTAAGVVQANVYSAVRVTIMGRDTDVRVVEIPEGSPVLVGQIPLEDLDLVPYPKEQRLIPNPEHGGEWMSDVY